VHAQVVSMEMLRINVGEAVRITKSGYCRTQENKRASGAHGC
jgi:hypothetical protein